MRLTIIPGALALLPEYAARADPLPDLRAACRCAVDWAGPSPQIIADEQGVRVAQSLMATGGDSTESVVVVLNGSARRTEQSPGPYDPRAAAFDDELERALTAPDPAALKALDQDLAAELWAATTTVPRLAELLTGDEDVTVDYAGSPYGVQYWVVRYGR